LYAVFNISVAEVLYNWENLCLFLVTCCMTVQSAIFYITKLLTVQPLFIQYIM